MLNCGGLVHYDPSKKIILSCDLSSYGVEALLSHTINDEKRLIMKSTSFVNLFTGFISLWSPNSAFWDSVFLEYNFDNSYRKENKMHYYMSKHYVANEDEDLPLSAD